MAVEVAGAAARKATRNPEASRARILDAARQEFVSYGLSGARVDRIANLSGVNKRRQHVVEVVLEIGRASCRERV